MRMNWRALALVLVLCAAPLFAPDAKAQAYIRVTACGDPKPPAGASSGYMDVNGNICVGANVVASATTTATASATPTPVLAGASKALNIDLFSEMFVQPSFAGTPVDGTHGLPTNCIAGCSGGPADEAAFTFGTTPIFTGGVFQTTATSNQLTTGQVGVVQMTANRAFHTNLRTAAGVETGIAAAPLQVSLANTGANATPVNVAGTGTAGTANAGVVTVQGIASMTKLLVTPDSVALPANQSVNTAQVNGVTTLTSTGAVGTGAQRVAVGTDTATIAGSAPGTAGTASANAVTVQGIASMTPVQVSQATAANLNATVVQATGSNLHIVCDSGCSGSGGTSLADEAAYNVGTTAFTPVGGFFQTTATSGPLTNGQGGWSQMTSNRAMHMNLRTAAGVETGIAAAPLQVSLANTGANASKLLVTPDSVALPANQSVNVAQVGGTNTVNGGLAGSQSVGGTVATNVAISANPINTGAQAVSSENTAVTTARQVQLVADLVGKLIVLPYANPENFVSGVITSAMTGTTSTSLIAAPAAGLRNYITQCTFSNSHATVGTDIILQDGSGGTTIYLAPAAPAFGGATITFPTPLRQPTTATALFVANVTTASNTKVACSGYKGA